VSSSGSNVGHYFIIKTLLNSVPNVRRQPSFSYRRSRWTQGIFFRKVSYSSHDVPSKMYQTVYKCVGFKVLTAVTTNNTIVWDVTPCNLVEIHRRFKGSYFLRLQCRRLSTASRAWFFLFFRLGLLFDLQAGSATFPRNFGGLIPDCTALHLRK
jgi:hypothetical protein